MHQTQLEESFGDKRATLPAALLITPALLQPVLVVASIFWARIESIMLHPATANSNPPTVSRAIVDPFIGDIFANLVLAAAILQSFAIWRIVRGLSATTEGRSKGLLSTAICFQAVGIFGMVLLTQYTGRISDSLHTLGSYMLFVGQSVAILLSGIIIYRDDRRRIGMPALSAAPYNARLHPPFAAFVTALAFVFGFLYYDPLRLIEWNDYGFRVTFAFVEITLLVSFELYLASFIAPMYRYERYRLER